MNVISRIILLIGSLSLLLSGKEVFANNSLQSKIDSIPEGGTLELKKGNYKESVILKKPIQLSGEAGTIFTACSSEPVITIKGENVKIKGVKIEKCTKRSNQPVIYISGKNHLIEDVNIDSIRTGVKLDHAEHVMMKDMKITGGEQERGIDLWQSHFNTFTGIEMVHVQDGFYMENSHYNRFIGNKISDSRYGLHVMFSDNITIKKNTSIRNFTGAMVMATNNTTVEENNLIDNNQNVNAQGLLLYDAHHLVVRNNKISNNRVGIYMEDSSGNVISNNEITANFIGAQINKNSNNKIIHNSFIRNVSEVQAIKGSNNLIRNNYWDGAWKLDTDGNGKSNIAYQADPYFLNLIDETPEYQLFFQAPGILLLQKMLKSPENKLVTDVSPLMKSEPHAQVHTKTNAAAVWILSMAMIMGSILLIIRGRKRF